MKINEKLRLMYVNRWNMVPTSREQSVAEHSYNVTVLAIELASRINFRQGLELDIDKVTRYAVIHDQIEALTGDIPTPTKSLLSDIHPMVMDRVVRRLDRDHRDDLSRYAGSPEAAIVKCADFIEAILYLDQYGIGRYAARVRDGLVTRFLSLIAKYEREILVEIDWVIVKEVLKELRVQV